MSADEISRIFEQDDARNVPGRGREAGSVALGIGAATSDLATTVGYALLRTNALRLPDVAGRPPPAAFPAPRGERGRTPDAPVVPVLLEPALLLPADDRPPLPAVADALLTPVDVLVAPVHVATATSAALDPIEGDTPSARAARNYAELDCLAALAAAGDEPALGRLLERVRPPVVHYCRARIGSRGAGLQMAEDVAQEVLLALCGALPRFKSGETRVMAFVYGIASNKVVDAFRAAGRDHSEPTDGVPDMADSGPGPESRAVLGAQVDELRTLLDRLPPTHREVLVMRVALQFSAEETAHAIGSTAGAVRVTQHRAMARLRRLIAADEPAPEPGRERPEHGWRSVADDG